MSKLGKLVFNMTKKYSPPFVTNFLYEKILGYHRVIDRAALMNFHQKQFSSGGVVSKASFLSKLFNYLYEQHDINLIIPALDVPCAQSFVPYYRGVTKALVYNFFSRNYGIRDPILFRFCIFSDSKPVWLCNQILKADQVYLFDASESQKNLDHLPRFGSLLVQAFHPRICTPNEQLRYFAIYHDQQQGLVSGTHSLQLPDRGIAKNWQPSFRAFSPVSNDIYLSTFNSVHLDAVSMPPQGSLNGSLSRISVREPLIGANSYYSIDHNQSPTSIWHDGPVPHWAPVSEYKKSIGTLKTALFVPDFESHAPVILFSYSQIGFEVKKLTISAFDGERKLVGNEVVKIDSENQSIDLKHVFGHYQLKGPHSFIVDFLRDIGEFQVLPVCYLHVYYRSGTRFGDQVHTENTIGYDNDPFRRHKSYRCRKFAPLLCTPDLRFIYCIYNVGGVIHNPERTVKIRIISDRETERVLHFPVGAESISCIEGETLLKEIDQQIDKAAIVQLEHETTNFSATWFAINTKTRHLGVDHFTGG